LWLIGVEGKKGGPSPGGSVPFSLGEGQRERRTAALVSMCSAKAMRIENGNLGDVIWHDHTLKILLPSRFEVISPSDFDGSKKNIDGAKKTIPRRGRVRSRTTLDRDQKNDQPAGERHGAVMEIIK
jgi:hypothetical protein